MTYALIGASLSRLLVPELDQGVAAVASRGEQLADLLAADGIAAHIAQRPDPNAVMSAAWLLEQPDVLEFLRSREVTGVIPFKTSQRLEKVARSAGLEVVAPPAALSRRLENKLELAQLAAEAGCDLPAQVAVTSLSPTDALERARAKTGGAVERWVFQRAQSFAGADTFSVDQPDDLAPAVTDDGVLAPGKLVAQAAGIPLTVTGIALTGSSVAVTAPVVQLTGVAGLTMRRFASCGNDWSVQVPRQVAEEVRDIARRLGLACARRGYRGMFGVDVVAQTDGSCLLIEINPRWTASLATTATICQLDGERGLVSLHAAAVSESLGAGTGEAAAGAWDDGWQDVMDAARAQGTFVAVAQAPEDVRAPDGPTVGILPLSHAAGSAASADSAGAGGLQPSAAGVLRPGWRLDEVSVGEALIFARDAGEPVAAGDEIRRIVARTGATRPFRPGIERDIPRASA